MPVYMFGVFVEPSCRFSCWFLVHLPIQDVNKKRYLHIKSCIKQRRKLLKSVQCPAAIIWWFVGSFPTSYRFRIWLRYVCLNEGKAEHKYWLWSKHSIELFKSDQCPVPKVWRFGGLFLTVANSAVCCDSAADPECVEKCLFEKKIGTWRSIHCLYLTLTFKDQVTALFQCWGIMGPFLPVAGLVGGFRIRCRFRTKFRNVFLNDSI